MIVGDCGLECALSSAFGRWMASVKRACGLGFGRNPLDDPRRAPRGSWRSGLSLARCCGPATRPAAGTLDRRPGTAAIKRTWMPRPEVRTTARGKLQSGGGSL